MAGRVDQMAGNVNQLAALIIRLEEKVDRLIDQGASRRELVCDAKLYPADSHGSALPPLHLEPVSLDSCSSIHSSWPEGEIKTQRGTIKANYTQADLQPVADEPFPPRSSGRGRELFNIFSPGGSDLAKQKLY